MSAVKAKDTRSEVLIRKVLWHRGMQFRKHIKNVPGKPDIVFTKVKLAVFCDGDFWHGHNWAIRGYGSLEQELARYSEMWAAKIKRNIARDEYINNELRQTGWTVLRIWESDIKADIKACADQIEYTYWNLKRNLENRGEEYEYHTESD